MRHELHALNRYAQHPGREGWVAWCTCGVGSPLKTTEAAAKAALAVHTSSGGKRYPA